MTAWIFKKSFLRPLLYTKNWWRDQLKNKIMFYFITTHLWMNVPAAHGKLYHIVCIAAGLRRSFSSYRSPSVRRWPPDNLYHQFGRFESEMLETRRPSLPSAFSVLISKTRLGQGHPQDKTKQWSTSLLLRPSHDVILFPIYTSAVLPLDGSSSLVSNQEQIYFCMSRGEGALATCHRPSKPHAATMTEI